jgi:hypothetical protein
MFIFCPTSSYGSRVVVGELVGSLSGLWRLAISALFCGLFKREAVAIEVCAVNLPIRLISVSPSIQSDPQIANATLTCHIHNGTTLLEKLMLMNSVIVTASILHNR